MKQNIHDMFKAHIEQIQHKTYISRADPHHTSNKHTITKRTQTQQIHTQTQPTHTHVHKQ